MKIKALAFDTGGTILDWHSGISAAFQRIGECHGIPFDCHSVTNDYRRLAMKCILGQVKVKFNMDDVHRTTLDHVLEKHGLQVFSFDDRYNIVQAWYELFVWPDFPNALVRMREKFPAISFTMLPLALVLNAFRQNHLNWDAVLSCEMIGTYKPDAKAYLKMAQWLGLKPADILMVSCHNFDLNSARSCGFKTAFIHRPAEWGPEDPPDPIPHNDNDIIVNDFYELAERLT